MPLLRLSDFSGSVPVSGDRALGDNFAVQSVNTWLYGAELRGLRPPLEVIAILGTTRRVFRIPKRTVGGDPAFPLAIPPPSYLGDSVWVQFVDENTDVVRGQLVEDSFERWYFCSKATGPLYNTYARLLSGLSMYKLGVPGPVVSPIPSADTPTIVSIVGGAVPVVTRAYVYTWVNDFGEESTPSLPVTGAGNASGTWNIGNIKDPPVVAGYANYLKKYLYRTVTGASGQTTFYRVAEIALGTLTYADVGTVTTDAVIVNNLLLESTTWGLPPADLEGFVAMPNGYLIGFAGSDIYMSESYHFHAWPAEYKQASEYPIVGMGVLGGTCVVATQGYPATISGVKPATAAFTKATTGEPALSRGSIVSTPSGVLYASQNGLQLVGPGGIVNVTEKIVTREQWIKNFAPPYLRAVRYQNGYLALRNVPSGTKSGFFLDPTTLKVALTEISVFGTVDGLDVDVWSGEVFTIEGAKIFRWDAPGSGLLPLLWLSKEFQFPYPENFGCYALHWDTARYSNNVFGLDIMPAAEQVRLRVFANRAVVYDQAVPLNGKPVRLPSGFKTDIWQFEIRSRAPVYSLHIASTEKELRGA